MRYSKLLVWLALAGGMALPGASTLSAQEYYGRNYVSRDSARDYGNVGRLRADIARDQARWDEAMRCGRRGEANAIARDIARDRQALSNQLRDIRHDRREGWRDGWR